MGKKNQKYTIGRVENITQVAPAQEPCIQSTEKKKPPESRKSLEATLNAVQTGLSELKASFEEFKEQSVQAPKKKFPQAQGTRKACPSCVEQGLMQKCQHCFICGDASHIARGCARRRNPKTGTSYSGTGTNCS